MIKSNYHFKSVYKENLSEKMVDNRIKTFLALCRNMNYRRTAEELNLTQPAVTQHIQHLESEYGCSLFNYDRRTLRLTKEGELLKNYAENVLYQERKLLEKIRTSEQKALSVGATKTIGEYVIPPMIKRYLDDTAGNITVDVDNTDRLLRRLKNGELDFALVEGFFDSNEFASRLYRHEPFIGICGKKHRFADKAVDLEDVFSEDLLIREKGSGTRTILEQLLEERNYTVEKFRRVVCISSFGLMTDLISKGTGITFAYKSVLSSGYVAPFYIAGSDTFRDFNFVYLDTPDAANAVDTFINICVKD